MDTTYNELLFYRYSSQVKNRAQGELLKRTYLEKTDQGSGGQNHPKVVCEGNNSYTDTISNDCNRIHPFCPAVCEYEWKDEATQHVSKV